MKQGITSRSKYGFTIVELVVVIAVIGILATAIVVAYHGWQQTTAENVIQSDLNGAASAMEDAKNWGSGYPSSIPTTFTPSKDVTLTGGGSGDGKTFCITGTSSDVPGESYYVSDTTSPQSGSCS